MNKWEKLVKFYIERDLKIIPILPNQKIPAIPNWNNDCSSSVTQILYWFEANRDMNWALPCKENGLFVLDLDVHDGNNGLLNFERLCHDLHIVEPDTLKQKTQGGGIHYIFKSDNMLQNVPGVANAFKNYPGIDIRNSNYILVEPSIIDTREYTFINDTEPKTIPDELKKFILDNAGTKEDNKKTPYEKPKEVYKGDRDNQLFKYINQLYYKTRLDEDEILVLAEHFNEQILEEAFPKKDVKYKVKKAFEKPRNDIIIIVLPDEE